MSEETFSRKENPVIYKTEKIEEHFKS